MTGGASAYYVPPTDNGGTFTVNSGAIAQMVEGKRPRRIPGRSHRAYYSGIELVEAPSERTVNRAMSGTEGLVVVDTPPGDERIVRAALGRADAVVIPTRAGGVEYSRVVATLDMIEGRTPFGVVISAARLGTRDLDEAVRWWTDSKVPIWGIVPERVGIAAGPEAKLYREGLDEYDAVLKKAVRRRST